MGCATSVESPNRAGLVAAGALLALALGALGCQGNAYSGQDLAELDESIDVTGDDDGQHSTANAGASPSLLDGASLSSEAITRLIRERAYRGDGYRLVNPEPYPSTVAPGKTVALWVSEEAYDAMLAVSPARTGSGSSVPVGSVIVREVLSGDALDAITVMVKMPKGAFPLGGDYFYAATDPDGTVRMHAEDGTPIVGLLERCGTCHLRRSEDDFLFGVPDDYLP